MRFVSAVLFVALTGSMAVADEAKPADPKPEVAKAKVPLRVVRMLPETHQVLLLDKNRGSHVVAEVGQDIDGFIVDEIADDEVTLIAPSGAEIILTAPDQTWRRRAAERKAAAAKAARPADPATSSADAAAPEDPYADEPSITTAPAGEVRSASAGGSAPVATPPTATIPSWITAPTETAAPATAAGAPSTPADPYGDDAGMIAFAEAVGAAPSPAPTPATAPTPVAAPATSDAAGTLAAAATGSPATPAGTVFTIARTDVDAALADFGATAVTFDARFVAQGLRIDTIAKGTLLDKAGLKKGDTITAVDGKPLRSFDDAADLYARMQTARTATIGIQRAGKPATLKVAIR